MALGGYAEFPGRLIPVGHTAYAISLLLSDATAHGRTELAKACALVLAGVDDEETRIARDLVHAEWE